MDSVERLKELEQQMEKQMEISLSQQKVIDHLTLIIRGNENDGIEGIIQRQRKDIEFKQEIINELKDLGLSITKQSESTNELKKEVEHLSKQMRDVTNWKDLWQRSIDIVTSGKFWGGFIFVVGIIILTALWVKGKFLNVISNF